MTGGGRDRSDLQSYDPERYLQSDDPNEMMGCHVGRFAGLNVMNAQPGRFYSWADESRQGIIQARLKHWKIVQPDDPERAGYTAMLGHDHQEIDSASSGYPGLVLVWRSAEDERQIRDEEDANRQNLLRSGPDEAYLRGGSAMEVQKGGRRTMGDNHRTHRTAGEDEGSQVTDAWTPDRGISS